MTDGKLLHLFGQGGSIILSAILLMAPAFYNGYPFVWYDSEMYLRYVQTSIRPPFYSLLLYPMHLRWSLWLVVFWQSLILSHLLHLTARQTFGDIKAFRYLSIVAILTLFSSLPWITGFIMADIYTPVLILAMYLLAFCAATLTQIERFYLYLLTLIAILVHSSNVPLAFILLMIMGLVKIYFNKSKAFYMNSIFRLAAPLLIGTGIILSHNMLVHKCISLSPSGYAFVLARLIADGPAVAYLQKTCSSNRYAICNHLDELNIPSYIFLWGDNSPFYHKLGWFDGYRSEGTEIVLRTVTQYPFWTAQTAIRNMGLQLIALDMSWTYEPMNKFQLLTNTFKTYFQHEYYRCFDSKQNNGTLILKPIVTAHRIAILISCLLALIHFVRYWLGHDWRPVLLFLSIFIGILASSGLAGALSEPHPRFINRVVWMIVFFGVTATNAMSEKHRSHHQE